MQSGYIPLTEKFPERELSCKNGWMEGEENSTLLAFILKSDFVGPKMTTFTMLRSVLSADAIRLRVKPFDQTKNRPKTAVNTLWDLQRSM